MGLVDIGVAGMTVDVELESDALSKKKRHRLVSRRAAAHHRRRSRALLSSPEDSAANAAAAAAGGQSQQSNSSSSSFAARRSTPKRAAAGQAEAPSATGELILNADNFGAWFGAQKGKAGYAPPAPPPPPPFVDHTALCQAGGLLRTTTRPTMNLLILLRTGMVCMSIHQEGKSCGHVRSGFEWMFSVALLPGRP